MALSTALTDQQTVEEATVPRREPSANVLVIAEFDLLPNAINVWLATWTAIGHTAQQHPACHGFRLQQDHLTPTNARFLSSWEDRASFNRFVREVGLLWIERSTIYARRPVRYTAVELTPGSSDGTKCSEPVHEGESFHA